MTQVEVAQLLARPQSFMTAIEKGERRLDVVELLNLAAVIGFDPAELLDELMKTGANGD